MIACTHYFGNRFWGLRPNPPRADDVRQLIDAAHRAGAIDDPVFLADDRVWLFRGELDEVVPVAIGTIIADLYRLLGVEGDALGVGQGDPQRPANHGIPVESFAGESRFARRDCAEYAPPFVIECGYDAADLLLRHLYPDDFLLDPVDPHDAGRLHAFDQTAFFQPLGEGRAERRRLYLRARRLPIR